MYAKEIEHEETYATIENRRIVHLRREDSLDERARPYVADELEKVADTRKIYAKKRAQAYQALKSTGKEPDFPLDDLAKEYLEPATSPSQTTRKRKSRRRARRTRRV